MSDYEVRIGDRAVEPADGWRFEPDHAFRGTGRLTDGERSLAVTVEGTGADRTVTLRGRRIAVSVRSWRERLLAEAERAAQVQAGPVVVKATLPGLVVAIAVDEGDDVEEGAPLLTIEAMKMQNEVRAPRAGRVIEVGVRSGQAVATGAALLRLE
ncbi:MAG TPA: acetyl-CoA carboxylase biotin carboxyl carrier protein subunit [Candidatus Limnocylindrales bacterium]|nr:acetyl-CoA carboxylase biotin carboxyl carrier protein subunit [Candidatus Limnocylindrales bacterium]